jgi:hypothetical protein
VSILSRQPVADTVARLFAAAINPTPKPGKIFTGPYSHRILDGIGHNVPQEAPQAFSDAVFAADKQ